MGLPFQTESWIWYSLGVFIVACRILSRVLLLKSVKKLQVDDYLMLAVLATDTVLMVTINIAANTSSNLLAPGDDVGQFSPEERAHRIYGSKLVLVVEQMQCVTIWLIKACLLILYHRLTFQLRENLYIRILAIYIAVSFVVMEILYFGVWCRPFHNYWALPTPNIQCSAATNHLITNAVFNISSDILMLSIALSLFVRSRLPWDRKLILCGIFGLGVFVILSAVLNKYYSFTHPFGIQWTYWYVRESSTAILVANLPFLWTLLRRMFNLNSFSDPSRSTEVPWHSSRSARGRHPSGGLGRGTVTNSSDATNGHLTKGTQPSHSANSSVDMTPHSPKSTEAIETSSQPMWKEQGVFCRADLDDLAVDPWDYGDDFGSRNDYYENTFTMSMKRESGERPTSPSHRRRLRDEEAQYAMQDGLNLKYYELEEFDSDGNRKT